MPRVLIVDYGLGNLFSIQNACRRCGIETTLSSEKECVGSADGVILPGVGAFGDAMTNLARLDLISPLRDFAQSGKPLLGICLGFQMLFTESWEFGRHRGLDLFAGEVVPLKQDASQDMRVPQVGWNQLIPARDWGNSFLQGACESSWFYFVHSFRAVPGDPACCLSTTRYVGLEFCSSVQSGNVFGCQFHPERSGEDGLSIYRELARRLEK